MNDLDTTIPLEPGPVLDRIGCGAAEPPRRIASLVGDYLENCHELIAPAWASVERRITDIEGCRVRLDDGTMLASPLLSRMLARGERVVVFAVTIGGFLDEVIAQLSAGGDILQASVLDAVGSSAVEKLVKMVETRIRERAAEAGLAAGRRVSPGYCDWDVAQQGELFKALGGDTAGIELSASGCMTPRKSLASIMGLGRPENGIAAFYPCGGCPNGDCPGRHG